MANSLVGVRRDGRKIHITRDFPASLDGLMPTRVWENFCDDVERALQPVEDRRKLITALLGWAAITLWLGSALFLWFVVFEKRNNLSQGLEIFFAFIPTSYGAALLIGTLDQMKCLQTIEMLNNRLQEVCIQYENRFSQLSITPGSVSKHIWLKDTDEEFVRIRIGPSEELDLENDSSLPGNTLVTKSLSDIPVAIVLDNVDEEDNIKVRLQNLEMAKAYLTDDEYKEKREEIIDSL